MYCLLLLISSISCNSYHSCGFFWFHTYKFQLCSIMHDEQCFSIFKAQTTLFLFIFISRWPSTIQMNKNSPFYCTPFVHSNLFFPHFLLKLAWLWEITFSEEFNEIIFFSSSDFFKRGVIINIMIFYKPCIYICRESYYTLSNLPFAAFS